jgi:DNA-binding response OmpR family regulator
MLIWSKHKQRCVLIATSDNAVVTILMLEPDVLVRSTISEFLRECGYHVIEGVSAQDARSVIQSGQRLDVVLSEVQLPGSTTGFSLASELRQTHPEIDVILTSGVHAAAEKSSELCEHGPIPKPYHPRDLAARIHVLLERRRASKKN